jgi:hypothetical protein
VNDTYTPGPGREAIDLLVDAVQAALPGIPSQLVVDAIAQSRPVWEVLQLMGTVGAFAGPVCLELLPGWIADGTVTEAITSVGRILHPLSE